MNLTPLQGFIFGIGLITTAAMFAYVVRFMIDMAVHFEVERRQRMKRNALKRVCR